MSCHVMSCHFMLNMQEVLLKTQTLSQVKFLSQFQYCWTNRHMLSQDSCFKTKGKIEELTEKVFSLISTLLPS